MRDYVILTDSCCDLNRKETESLSLTVLPMLYQFDGETLEDSPHITDITPDVFFDKLAHGAACKTSAINIGQYTDAMRRILDEGKDILCVCFSSGLSTTYQSACIAADDLREQYSEAKIIVIDSLCASRGEGMLLYRAVQARRAGNLDIEALADYIRDAIAHQCHYFMVDDLNQLKRGGRISAAAALAGGMLGIKPILKIDNEGHIVPFGKARGVKAAIKLMLARMEELTDASMRKEPVFICHANCQDNVDYLTLELKERFGITDVHSDYLGPVIGTHTGIGVVSLFFVGSER